MVKFDEQHYLFLNDDVKKSGQSALEHWLIWGRYEKREHKLIESSHVKTNSSIEKGKVSVIMSVKHGSDKAINSILNQTYKNFELILIGGKKTNEKIKIIDSYDWQPAKRYNSGILQSSGEFIAFMFENCEWMPDCLETFISNIGNNAMISAKVSFAGEEFGEELNSKCYSYVTLPNNGVMLRKSVFEDLGCFDESVEFIKSEDLEMWARIYYKKQKTKFISRVIGSQSDNSYETMHIDRKMAYANLILRYDCFNEKYYLNNNLDVKEAVNRHAFHSGLHHFLGFGYGEFRLMCSPIARSIKI